MPLSGEQILHDITQDVPCPACGYNLRGLSGDVVGCPECGQMCDVGELVKRRWVGSWRSVPGLATVCWPAVWLLLATLTIGAQLARSLGLFYAVVSGHGYRHPLIIFLSLCAVTIPPVWLWLMCRVWRHWPGWRGLGLALLAHGVLAAYLAGVAPLFFIPVVFHGSRPIDRRAVTILAIAGPLICALSWFAGYRGYRYLADRCIRRRLRGGETPGGGGRRLM
jgi:hypothetical protein